MEPALNRLVTDHVKIGPITKIVTAPLLDDAVGICAVGQGGVRDEDDLA